MTYALFAPGKRFRPVLTLLAAEAVGGDINQVLPTACAFEFVHAYSLVHDDLPALDNDDFRRGQPTCHKKYGEDIAILAGDALCTEAFTLVAAEQSKYSPSESVIKVLAEMGRAAGVRGMVGGQAVDITATGRNPDQSTLEFMHHHKTGALIKAAAVSGAILGGGTEKQIGAIDEYALQLGLAFQIIDDVLDVIGSTPSVGRPVGSDENNRKTTFASMMGVDDSLRAARAQVNQAKAALGGVVLERERLTNLAEFVLVRSS
jgi:geranylgeranyl diphosphate synthase type II